MGHTSADRFRPGIGARVLAGAGLLAGLIGICAREVRAAPKPSAVRQEVMQRIWAQKVRLSVEGETVEDLFYHISQQLLAHIMADDDLGQEPITVFAAHCTFSDVRDAFRELFQFTLSPYDNAESVHFRLWEDPDVRRAALSKDPAPAKKPAGRPAPPPAAAAPSDPELLKLLSIPKDLKPIAQEDLFLPAMQQRLAKIAGIRIFSDYADRTEECLGSQSAEAFFRGLDGLPLHAALDRIATQFHYTWRKSHGWYLFRSRTWKAERQTRVAEAMKAAEEDAEGPVDNFNP